MRERRAGPLVIYEMRDRGDQVNVDIPAQQVSYEPGELLVSLTFLDSLAHDRKPLTGRRRLAPPAGIVCNQLEQPDRTCRERGSLVGLITAPLRAGAGRRQNVAAVAAYIDAWPDPAGAVG